MIGSDLEKVLLAVKKRQRANRESNILIFSDLTGKQMDFDLSGTEAEVVERHKMYTTKTPIAQVAGDLPNFEESIRFLYRSDRKKFIELISDWHEDIIEYALVLAEDAFGK